jgi:hypothetical protein
MIEIEITENHRKNAEPPTPLLKGQFLTYMYSDCVMHLRKKKDFSFMQKLFSGSLHCPLCTGLTVSVLA